MTVISLTGIIILPNHGRIGFSLIFRYGVDTASLAENKASFNKATRKFRNLELHTLIKVAVIALLFYLLFRNELNKILHRWLTDPSWSHGFLIPFFSLYFLNQRKKEIFNARLGPNYWGLALMLLGISIYVYNFASPSGYAYLRRLSSIVTLGGIVLFLGGWQLIKYTWLPVLFLIFAVPLPERYYVQITRPMRELAAQVAGFFLNMVDSVNATVRGVVIDVTHNGQPVEPSLNVADACSGMRLLMAFLALGVAMAYIHRRPVFQRLILLASTIPIALFCNSVRVTTTGFIYVFIDPKYARGIYHDMLGVAMLGLAFLLYDALAWFMSNLFTEQIQEQKVQRDVIVRRKKA